MADKIKYELVNPTVTPLSPGQLGYSYSSGTLFIGPSNLSKGGVDVIEVIKFQNSVLNYIVQEIQDELVDKIPSSKAVNDALSKKAGLEQSNTFTSANYFPDIELNSLPVSQERLVVNAKSLKKYVSEVISKLSSEIINDATIQILHQDVIVNITQNILTNITTEVLDSITPTVVSDISANVSSSLKIPHIRRYEFLESADTWIISHGFNTDKISIMIFELGTNRQIISPFEILDNNNIRITFSKPTSGYVDIQFF
jgi:6-pyruvoyl-tetrahydropterin synthase